MAPALHNWHVQADAVAAFGEGDAEEYCDGQFLVLPSFVLCFVTTGQSLDEPHVSSPSQIVWRPKLGTPPTNQYHWIPPRKVLDVWDRSGQQVQKLRSHQIYVRTTSDELFFYAGEAHLGSHGSSRTTSGEWGFAANFSLSQKLPRDIWLKFGGYSGWLVDLNHKCQRIEAGDMPAFEQLVGDLSRAEFSHLYMTRYEEDSLTVHTNSRRGWLMYLRYPSDGGLYTRDLEYSGPVDTEEVFQCGCGIHLEFKATQTLTRELAQQAALDFFQTGRLPECVHWELD